VAFSVARFTTARCTPGVRLRARSTKLEQEAQVMPSMLRVVVSVAAGMAAIGLAGSGIRGIELMAGTRVEGIASVIQYSVDSCPVLV
jgi:hypothetical protein